MHFKRLNRVFVMRRDKNNPGKTIHAQSTDDLEAIHLWHLHVEEQEVRIALLYATHRIWAVASFSHDVDTWILAQEAKDFPARGNLVVGDEHPQWRNCAHRAATSVLRGRRMVTVRPSAFSRNICCFFP